MSWVAYLYDTVSGQLAQEIDIPSFTWSMTVSDSSFSTTKDKGVGDDEVSGLELPWSQIPGDDPAARRLRGEHERDVGGDESLVLP